MALCTPFLSLSPVKIPVRVTGCPGGGGVDVRQGVVGWALVWLLVVGGVVGTQVLRSAFPEVHVPPPPLPPSFPLLPAKPVVRLAVWGGGGLGGCWLDGNLSLSLAGAGVNI